MRTCKVFAAAAVLVGLSLLTGSTIVRSAGDTLEQGFADPPDEASPRV